MVCERFFGSDVENIEIVPVRATLRDAINDVLALWRPRERTESRRAVGGKLVRIEQHIRRAVEALLNVINALILQAVIFGEKKPFAAPGGCADLRIIEELRKAVFYPRSVGYLIEVSERYLVLSLDPVGNFLRVVILKPAIRIGYLCTEVIVHLIATLRLRIVNFGLGLGIGGQESAKQQERESSFKHNAFHTPDSK